MAKPDQNSENKEVYILVSISGTGETNVYVAEEGSFTSLNFLKINIPF